LITGLENWAVSHRRQPRDLPVDLPTVSDFAVNVRTAQSFGIITSVDVAAQVMEWVN
jgi:hypothetical protein